MPGKPREAEQPEWDDLATHYHDDVITPFDPDVDFRLPRDVERILRGWRREGTWPRRVVIDFGCGIGEAIELVAGRVGLAAGVDFSAGMLEQSQRRLERAGREVRLLRGPGGLRTLRRLADRRRQASVSERAKTVLANGNLLHLTPLRGVCDAALAINSTAAETCAQAFRMVEQISASVKTGGWLIAVFPALDNIEYLRRLHVRHGRTTAGLGHVSDDGRMYIHGDGQMQKFFTPEEIRGMCGRCGLHIERLEKIRYPWKVIDRYGWGYFPGSPRLWDWYLVSRKD